MPTTRPRSDTTPEPEPTIPLGPTTPEGVKFTPKMEKLRVNVEGIYMGVGGLVSMADPAYGMHIASNAEAISIAWIELALVNPAVLRFVERFTSGGAAGQLIAMHIALLMPLAVKYNLLPGMAMFSQAEEPATNGYDPGMN